MRSKPSFHPSVKIFFCANFIFYICLCVKSLCDECLNTIVVAIAEFSLVQGSCVTISWGDSHLFLSSPSITSSQTCHSLYYQITINFNPSTFKFIQGNRFLLHKLAFLLDQLLLKLSKGITSQSLQLSEGIISTCSFWCLFSCHSWSG